ncbi:TOM2AH3 [Linum grandiflorum]
MTRVMRSCVQSILKLVNSVGGMVGLGMVLYAVWLIRAWQRETGEFPFGDFDNFSAPWFIYTFLGLGAALCVITCFGHVSAEIANGCCLYLYMMFMFLLIMLEAAVTVDVFLNRDWEKDFPNDPSGCFDRFKSFIRSHFEICKWVGLSIVAVQALSFLLAMVLKGLGPHRYYYDSNDDFIPERAPLLRNPVYQPGYVVGNPILAPRTDPWNSRVNDKVR